ncbi:MAG: chitobiase/beta-hexosaminidase C-terminal domain-containing protein [Acidobacteriota bacterium]
MNRSSTTSGGGTWGSILRLTGSISGSNVTFTVSKQSGTFSSSGTMYLKVGTYQPYGTNRDSAYVSAGSSSVSFTHDLSDFTGYPKHFYGRYESSQGGYAWVGPITVSFTDSPPSFSWSSPSSGSTQTGSFTVSGTAYDSDKLAKVTIALVDSTGASQNIVAFQDSTPSSSARSISRTINPASYGLAPGSMSVGIWIVDGAGNTGAGNCGCAVTSRTINWRRPDSPPSFSWSSPSSGSTQTGSFTVSGTAYDSDRLAKVTIALVDSTGASQNIVAFQDSTPSSSSRSISRTINPASYGLAPGSMSVGIWIVDGDGNTGADNCGCPVTYRIINWQQPDSHPSFSWSSPSSGSTQTGSFTVSGTAYDSDRLAKVTIALVDSTGASQNIVAFQDSTPSSSSRSISRTINPASYGLAPGDMSVGIWIVDGDGNTGADNCGCPVTYRIINWQQPDSHPSFSWSNPASGSSQSGSFTVSGTASDSDLVEIVTIALVQGARRQNIRVHEPPATAVPSVSVNRSINPADYGFVAGSLNIGIWIVDADGNTGPDDCDCAVTDRTVQWSPDSAGSFDWEGPAAGSSQFGKFTVSGTASDADLMKVVSIALYQNGMSHNIQVHEPPAPPRASLYVNREVDPEALGFIAGDLNIGIWIKDVNDNTIPVSDRTVQWSPDSAGSFAWEGPAAGSNQSGSFTVSGTASDADLMEVVSIALYQNGMSHNIRVHEPPSTPRASLYVSQEVDPEALGFVAGDLNIGIWIVDVNENGGPVTDRTVQWSPDPGGVTYVNVSPWAQDAAHFLVLNGIIEDPPDHDLRGIFDGNRAEVATMLYRALGDGLANADASFASWFGAPLRSLFADVADPDAWYFKSATYLGMLAYTGDDDQATPFNQAPCIFRPAQTISRAWILKALLETWDIAPLTHFGGVTLFDDVPTSHPAAGYIYAARQKALISGTNNLYRPDEWADRQDLFVMLHRLLDPTANPLGEVIAQPTPQSADFLQRGLCSRIGHRYEQPVLSGVQPPTVGIDATDPQPEALGALQGIYTAELQAVITNLDPNAHDDNGVSRTASAFCSWQAAGGTFIDLDPGASRPFCRVKWVAPSDVSPASGGAAKFDIRLYVGDSLGSEVMEQITLDFTQTSGDAALPTVSIDPLPAGMTSGELIDIEGSVADSSGADEADFGILSVQLRYSLNGGGDWLDLGSAELLGGGRWRHPWSLPQASGAVVVEARATNLRGNHATVVRFGTIGALLAIQGSVVDSYGQPVENALVTLVGGGLNVEVRADDEGSFRLTSGDGLSLGSSYTLTAGFDGRSSVLSGIVLSSDMPTIHPVLTLDTAPPFTLASLPGGTYNDSLSVELTCSDDLSGCAATYYTLDGSTPTTASPLYGGALAIDDSTTLKFFSVDSENNVEAVTEENYVVSNCVFQLDRDSQTFDGAGGAGSVQLTVDASCTWDAVSNEGWITITSGTDYVGPATVDFSVAANDSGFARSGSMTIAGNSFTVNQDAQADLSPVIAISPLTLDFSSGARVTRVVGPAGAHSAGETPMTLYRLASQGHRVSSVEDPAIEGLEIEVDAVALESLPDRLELVLLDGSVLTAQRSRGERRAGGQVAWQGSAGEARIDLVAEAGLVAGRIETQDGRYRILPLPDGGHGLALLEPDSGSDSARPAGLATAEQTFSISNTGSADLIVGSIALESVAPWIAWSPPAPFTLAPGEQQVMTLTVDFGSAPAGQTSNRLLVSSNDSDASPFPDGVFVNVDNTVSTGDRDRVGVFRAPDRLFVTDNDGSGTSTPPADQTCQLGIVGDVPITGDWNGDGHDELGVYRPSTRQFLMDRNGDCAWDFGPGGDQACVFFGLEGTPLVGDWNGDGDDDVGLYLDRIFRLDLDESCSWTPATDEVALFGLAGDTPLVGDWNGDGDDDIGIYRPSNRVYLMDRDESGTWTPPGDQGCLFGLHNDTPIVGDWNHDGDDDLGVYRPMDRLFLMDRDENCQWSIVLDLWAIFGLEGDLPITGQW